MLARLRRVPLARRVNFMILLYLLAILVMTAAGLRIVTLVRDNRDAVTSLGDRADEIATMRRSVEQLQLLVKSYLNGGDPILPLQINAVAESLGVMLDSPEFEDEVFDKAPRRLRLSIQGFMDGFDRATVLNGRIMSVYLNDISTAAKQAAETLDTISRDRTAPHGGFAQQLLLTEKELAQARLDLQIFYGLSDGAGAERALESLRRVGVRIAAMRTDAAGSPVARDCDRAEADVETVIRSTRELVSLYAQRHKLAEGEVALYGRAMDVSIDVFETAFKHRQAGILDGLDRHLETTLQFTAAGALAVLLLGLFANRLIVRSIRDPILSLNAAMQDISQGNWDREIEVGDGRDEFTEMSRTLAGFKRNALRLRELEVEKREILAREKEETEAALARLDQAHHEINLLNERLNEENYRLGTELDVSRRLQQMLLPRPEELAAVRALDIAAYMEPAAEVGGDYYDVLSDGEGVCIGIGDVTGHGLESGVVMLMTQSAVRTLVTAEEHDLPRLLDVLNRTLFRNIRRMGSEKNLSFALLDYRPREALPQGSLEDGVAGRLTVVGQHESVLILRNGGGFEEVDTLMLGMPIGLVDEIGQYTGVAPIDLFSGDLMVLYSDGITEAVSRDGELFGVERLRAATQAHAAESVEAIKEGVIAAVRDHIGGATVYDDMTLLVARQK